MSKENLKKLFLQYDSDRNKSLSRKEMRSFTSDWADKYIFLKMDKDSDGRVTFEEFYDFIKKNQTLQKMAKDLDLEPMPDLDPEFQGKMNKS